MAPDIPHIDDIRRLWSEGRDVTEAARVTGRDRMAAETPEAGRLLSGGTRAKAGVTGPRFMNTDALSNTLSCTRSNVPLPVKNSSNG